MGSDRRRRAGPNFGRSAAERTIQTFLTVRYNFSSVSKKSTMLKKGSDQNPRTRRPESACSPAAHTCPRHLMLAGHLCHRARPPVFAGARVIALVSAVSARHGYNSNADGFQLVVTMVAASPSSPSPARRRH